MDNSWMADANCKGMDPDAFFPTRNDSSTTIGAVLKVCEQCTVQEQCLRWAVYFNERDGIWGNTTGRQRRRLRGQQIESGDYTARCIECGKEFPGHAHSRLCSDACRDVRLKESRQKYQSSKKGVA